MKKIFLLLIITFHALFTTTNPLHAYCNQSEDPDNVFEIHGEDKDNKAVIEGECLNELHKAIGEGKDIDIEYAEIKGDIDFTNPEFSPAYSFDEAKEKKLLSQDEIARINLIVKIVLVKGDIRITRSVINGDIKRSSVIFFKKGVDFYNTQFVKVADFMSAQFAGGADFGSAQFAGEAKFWFAQFAGRADFMSAQFAGVANFRSANLSGADLYYADLGKKANLVGANLDSVRFELKPGAPLPLIRGIAHAKNLSKMWYRDSPDSLVELRKAFKEKGFRQQEREITYAIEHTRNIKQLLFEEGIAGAVKGLFKFIFFELTSKYGMSPGRPLWIMFFLFLICLIPYRIALKNTHGRAGIWQDWEKGRVYKDEGQDEPIRLCANKCKHDGIWRALQFSLLAAFRIGWRDINPGHWIARMQHQEYTLRATGWVRTVAGVQSLISVYLMALSILTYFGRPFEL